MDLRRLFGLALVLGSPVLSPAQSLFGGKVTLAAESRARYEIRDGVDFGRSPDQATGLVRNRLSATWKAAEWLKVSAMAQDSRAPWYGPAAPSSVRDPIDLQEGYVELWGGRKRGFGLSAGRRMLNYGEGRLIGSPQWSSSSRSWDHARLWYRIPKGQLELLFLSPVKVRLGEFNRPALGDRVWGAYNAFPGVYRKSLLEFYVLRHDQNRPGGFSGAGRLGVNSAGLRLAGPFAAGTKYSVEAVTQTGKVGSAHHRAEAWFAALSRRWPAGKRTIDLSGEYKYASGTSDPSDSARSGTFDQIYPANHDKFGHQDLFGWRNLHNARSLATVGVTGNLAVNFMYNNSWLASPRDSLYNSSGKSIARSAAGTAGRHIGQETDLFLTYRWGKHLQIGAGYGYLFKGEFVNRTTSGVNPNYVYLFHTVTL